jgi:P27 family predicted phage terminase small subunit
MTQNMKKKKIQPSLSGLVEEMPAPPARLDEPAQQYWTKIGAELCKAWVLRESDLPEFEVLSVHAGIFEEACRELKEEGIVYTDKNGQKRRHPALMILKQATDVLDRLEAKFFLTPKSRHSAGLTEQTDPDNYLDSPVR